MTRLLWMVLRFSLSAWVGAASLFVVTGILEVTTKTFEATTKNQLAALRFPAFYAFGFTLVSLGTLSSICLRLRCSRKSRPLSITIAMCIAALVTMMFDYLRVYLPLEALMLRPDARAFPEFWELHQWSKWLNFIALTCVCIAAALAVSHEPETKSATVET